MQVGVGPKKIGQISINGKTVQGRSPRERNLNLAKKLEFKDGRLKEDS